MQTLIPMTMTTKMVVTTPVFAVVRMVSEYRVGLLLLNSLPKMDCDTSLDVITARNWSFQFTITPNEHGNGNIDVKEKVAVGRNNLECL
mmetsp:Transcript_2337/g.3848  ORF Transcript_2337/g.3848 Transcript_2337/m.3848 type:complete len:89 (+) Transcript_2337:110-376(+)